MDEPIRHDMACSGPVCISFSRIGKRKGTTDPAYETHRQYYKKLKKMCHVFIIENVPQYGEQNIRDELGPEWCMRSHVIDPRIFGIGAARSRLYAICWKVSTVHWRDDVSMEAILEALTASVEFGAGSFFWQDLPMDTLTPAQAF